MTEDAVPYRMITTAEELECVVDALVDEDRFALDTEFHRERTYYPKVALVQIAWPGNLVLIDPLQVSLEPLAKALGSDTIVVMHAASQDLEVLDLACGVAPTQMFDTQIAAGFLGMATPSLGALHERFLNLRLPKGNRLTDWLERPLRPEQLDYAASDVAHLLRIHDLLIEQLEAKGRLSWAATECEVARQKSIPRRDPQDAWQRIKEARHLKGRSLAIAQAVAAWREERAATTDQPVRFILPDLAVVAVAQRAPKTLDDLRKIRGLDDRHAKGGPFAENLLGLVARGAEADPPSRQSTNRGEPSRELRPAVALVSAWVSQLANNLDLDASLLGTRSDIEALVRRDPDAKMAQGWRAEVAGEPIRRLIDGEAALAFETSTGLVLEPRSAR